VERVKVHNVSRNVYLAEDAGMATSFLRRGLGLMFRKHLPEGSGLVLIPEGQIHMFFMRFPLDVIHADREGTVLRILEGIKPWRLGPMVRKCRMVVELPAGTAQRTGTQVGDTLALEPLDR
jgi:uncharacterized membrane protein (UPF0127 family)